MPISETDIALTNSFESLKNNRFAAASIAGIVHALKIAKLIETCKDCDGKGYIPPASSWPNCKSCDGAGFYATRGK